MSREYLIKGIDDEDVTHYYNYMQKVKNEITAMHIFIHIFVISKHYNTQLIEILFVNQVAILLGADPVRAASELKESLLFEIKLANTSLPREERRNASKLYNPMKLNEMSKVADIVNWTTYVNNVLTDDLIQVLL